MLLDAGLGQHAYPQGGAKGLTPTHRAQRHARLVVRRSDDRAVQDSQHLFWGHSGRGYEPAWSTDQHQSVISTTTPGYSFKECQSWAAFRGALAFRRFLLAATGWVLLRRTVLLHVKKGETYIGS